VFCNTRYRDIYGLSPEQVRPGTPISELIQHRLDLGLKVRTAREDYIRERVGREMVEDSAVHEFMDRRVIAFKIYPLPDGSGMATHEDITEREEIRARLERQYELGKAQEEKLQLRNLQFDTAVNNMSQGLCFFDADHRLIVCNDLYIDMYDLPRDRVGPGTTLSEIVDMRFEAGSFPEMSREEYLRWRSSVAISAKPTESIIEMRNGKTFKIRHRPMPDLGWVATHEDITEQRQADQDRAYGSPRRADRSCQPGAVEPAARAGVKPFRIRQDRRGASP
jgi:PAS domain-containing protein